VGYSQDRTGPYEGVLLRNWGWNSLQLNTLDYVRSHFARVAVVSPRNWYKNNSSDEKSYVVVRRGERSARALGLVGLTPQEKEVSGFDKAVQQGRFFERADELSCLLPQRMAAELGLEAADIGQAKVQVFGRELLVCGLIDAQVAGEIRDLDGETLMPVDFQMSAFQGSGPEAAAAKSAAADQAVNEAQSVVHIEPENVLILPYQVLEEIGGAPSAVAVRFNADVDGQTLIEEFLLRVAATLFAGLRDTDGSIQVYAYSSIGLTSIEGMGALAVPALIAALIVLNAMLGAVYERLREIAIYSSVGLAPVHISLLFIAEACVYAVLGVTLGYLFGQGLGKLLISLDLLEGVNLNYSSMAAVVSALIVMIVVLISTIYPARIAARTAVTDTVLRRWQPPPPEGDDWRFSFPFRVSEGEVRGMCGFLYNYFNSFQQAGSGEMITDRVRLMLEDGWHVVALQVWLPPFDLGVSQEVRLVFEPTETPGSYGIEVQLQRISGEQLNWQRLNRLFMNRLRKQILIWHTLADGQRQRHRETAVEMLDASLPEIVEAAETADAEDTRAGKSPFTWKGLLVGALGSLCIGIGAPYSIVVLQGSWMAINSSSPGAIFLFFILAFFMNTALSLIRRRLALSRADLVLVYAMLLIAIAVPNQAFVGYLIPVISGLYYYATPENKWAELFFPHVESWLVPQDVKVLVDLHEGLPPGGSIPWGAWVEPLASWYAFFLVLSFMMICMSSILHRQWSTHERLAYPMVELPLQIIDEGKGAMGHLRPFFKNRLMWIGFAVPALLLGMNGLNHYVPSVPQFDRSFGSLLIFENRISLPMSVEFAWVGFFYMVNLDVSAGVWVFYVLSKIQEGFFKTLGIASTEQLSLYSYSQMADITHQSMGACLAFVGYILWLARHHLRDVWRKAWYGDETVDDSEELLSYRVAVFGFLGSLVFVAGWLWASGVPMIVLPLFLVTCLIFYIMVTRVVAAAGVATARSPMVAAFFVISGVGSSIIGAKGLVALALTYVWQSEMRLFPMIACANGLKLAETVKGPKGRLFWGLVIALLCSLVGATFIILTVCYENGGINMHSFFMRHQAQRTFADMARPIVHPMGMDVRGWVFTGIGAAVEGLLVLAQYRLHWWPLHPIGFIIGAGWLTSQIWFSVLVAWTVKVVILKYGGGRAFNAGKPFFLGLILGEACIAGFWLVVDWLAGESGNFITHM
jgi:cell division protein FtsX